MAKKYGIHWFRRDLRIDENVALYKNCHENAGKVIGIFCFDAKFLARDDFSHNRFGFFLQTLKELKKQLQGLGSDLLIVDAMPEEAFTKLFIYLKKINCLPNLLTFNRDYEPYARKRDQQISLLFEKHGVRYFSERDHLIIEPQELIKDIEGSFYQVYTPFYRKWFDLLNGPYNGRTEGIKEKFKANFQWKDIADKQFPYIDRLEDFITENAKHQTIPLPPAGEIAAKKQLDVFKKKYPLYSTGRDFPAQEQTSHLSIYLKNGSITASRIVKSLACNQRENRFLKEIAWREFYYHILYHCPRVESESFLPQYKNLNWQNNQNWFERWCEGTTGYPIVDAGMRQLRQEGWMHNRVRMIVASFLTKDLLIDWRWGERHFMKLLLDGDLAPNNGGWQWASSTGCDPQPYFRIFNPILQSKKFDLEGEYIRKYVPELAKIKNEQIHEPWLLNEITNYPKPIVDHSVQKTKAIQMYTEAKNKK